MNIGPFELNRIHQGDALMNLKRLPDNSVHVCVTSPPYWGLRDYGLPESVFGGDPECDHEFESHPGISTGPGGSHKQRSAGGSFCRKCGAWKGCLGLEPTPEMYVEHLVEILMEVRRVLRKDGTLYLNLGDSFSSSSKGSGGPSKKQSSNKGSRYPVRRFHHGLKDKDLVGIPWKVAFALRDAGWWLRQDIIWEKGNAMCENVTDRCTKAHEYVFLMAKSKTYYFDHVAIKVPGKSKGKVLVAENENADARKTGEIYKYKEAHASGTRTGVNLSAPYKGVDWSVRGVNRRSVWQINTRPFKGAHFAVFPKALAEPPILAGTSEKGCCPDCGAPWMRVTEKVGTDRQRWKPGIEQYHTKAKGAHGKTSSFSTGDVAIRQTVGWEQTCDCGKDPVPCIVLDPFAGSGTTGVVAIENGRDFIGFDLSVKYCNEISNPRLEKAKAESLMLFESRREEEAK